MTEPPRSNPAAAGAMLLATIVSCAGVGFAIGAALGLLVPLGLAGVFAGLIAGFALVYTRFRRI